MKPDVIDRLGDAGIATFNLAVDSVAEKKIFAKGTESYTTLLRLSCEAAASLWLFSDVQYQHLP